MSNIAFKGIPRKYEDYLRPVVMEILNMGRHDPNLLFVAPRQVEVRVAARAEDDWQRLCFRFSTTEEEVWAIQNYLFAAGPRCWLRVTKVEETTTKRIVYDTRRK